MWSSSIKSKAQESIMIADTVEYAKRYKACQIHVDFIHQPPELLHPTVAAWSFKAWGIDVI